MSQAADLEATHGVDIFGPTLRDTGCWLELATGERIELSSDRWRATACPADETMLDRCAGPTLDVGCGPGRLTVALTRRGVPALGVDVSPIAVAMTRARGGTALRRDVYGPLPGEGHWNHILLADGNIGIGGDPVRLLRRLRELLTPGGTALIETHRPGIGLRPARARLTQTGPWFDWAFLGADAVPATARGAGFDVGWLGHREDRWFAELVRR
ncbi:class I SAM-dependent methyltransferase [Actinokineospora xionganensis]|uniref:Class I SAM-dependent methyltransferase n=1 Tax=Actinokineospora xionganensis TaxID=2684470 RepID=A0ABR7L0R0_9PSEU|nr:class I SAM-dependent methyltransferase [Actinokineospora xionganensis]MBC6446108.1 class I SAM-dependent methyltransferase [Actinokineospora xionganensis]